MPNFETLAKQEYCYLTTKGRRSGKPHRIEIWFGLKDSTAYLLSGGGRDSDWVKNLLSDPEVKLRIGKQSFAAAARLVTDELEDAMARRLLAAKYYRWREGKPLNEWASTALPVAIEVVIN
ncbi:MAG: nitroreductase family deazaflavin-dependent oxidoreductase [Anaerolineales bacterium]